MGQGQHRRFLRWPSHWQRSLILIVSASARDTVNVTKHRHKAHQPARGKWYQRNPTRLGIDSAAGMT
jgi:hypothetical protein